MQLWLANTYIRVFDIATAATAAAAAQQWSLERKGIVKEGLLGKESLRSIITA
jgi:hypothetical protein